jgi:hypothetical protein
MSYIKALEQAGAKVLAEKRFGSYQGDWVVKLSYNGASGWTIFKENAWYATPTKASKLKKVKTKAKAKKVMRS